MNITSAVYTLEDNSSLKATLDDGAEWHMPQPCQTWHSEILQAYLDGGGVISPYELPSEAEPTRINTADPRLDALEAVLTSILTRLNALEEKHKS